MDSINNAHLSNLQGSAVTFYAEDEIVSYKQINNKESLQQLLNNCLATTEIVLKENAQVMLLRNLNNKLINGSRGVIVGFQGKNSYACYANAVDSTHKGDDR